MNIVLDPQWWSLETPERNEAAIDRRIEGLEEITRKGYEGFAEIYRPEAASTQLMAMTLDRLRERLISAGSHHDAQQVFGFFHQAYNRATPLASLTKIKEVACNDGLIAPSFVMDRLNPDTGSDFLNDLVSVAITPSSIQLYCEPSGHSNGEDAISLGFSDGLMIRAGSQDLESLDASKETVKIPVSHNWEKALGICSLMDLWRNKEFDLAMSKTFHELVPAEAERSRYTFKEYRKPSSRFFESVREIGRDRNEGTLKQIMWAACRLAIGRHLQHETIAGWKPREDGAILRRARVSQGDRLHYFQLPDGSLEFDEVVPHDTGLGGKKVPGGGHS